MALEAKIHKDITEYEGKLVFGMTGKQLICVLIALAIAVPTFIFTYKYIGVEVAGYLCMIIPLPVLLVGFFKFKGVSFNELVKRYINYRKNKKELRYCCRVSTDYFEKEACVNDRRSRKTVRGSNNRKATRDRVEYIRRFGYTANTPKQLKEKRKQIKKHYEAYRAEYVLQQKERVKRGA